MKRFSSKYDNTLVLVLTQQVLLGLLVGILTNGGVLERMYLSTLAAFWTGFALILLKRPHTPTEVDLFLIKWGTILLFLSFFAFLSVFLMFTGAV